MSNTIRTTPVVDVDVSYINNYFNDYTGALATILSGYARREGQVQLACAVHEAIVNETILLGEAPTGSGKSMAYLIPAIHHAIAHNKRVLVVTANKALQEQLIDKDLPTLRKAFQAKEHLNFSYALLKGRANYLCRREMNAFDKGMPVPGLDFHGATEAAALSAWAMITPTGDQSDAPLATSQRTWNQFSVTGEQCTRNACPFRETCFAERAIDDADAAQVVVVNYDLLFSKLQHGNEHLLSNFGVVIFDEAHETADIARRSFGTELGYSHINQLANDVSKFLGDPDGLVKRLRDAAHAFFEEVMRFALN
jgi:ATP-dependent DNA helicase DinG